MIRTSVLALVFSCAEPPPASGMEGARAVDVPRSGVGWSAMRVASDAPSVTVYGLWPSWGDPLSTLPWDQLTHVAIVGADLAGDGSLGDTSGWSQAGAALLLAAPWGARVHLAATVVDPDLLLGSAAHRTAAIGALQAAVASRGAHGVHLDLRGLPLVHKAAYVSFVAELRAAVGEVVVSMPAVDAAGAYDFDELAFASDGLFVRGYDLRDESADPGPVAPLASGATWGPYSLQWSVTDYRTWGAPDPSLLLGLPLYGYEWPTVDASVPGLATGPGLPLTHTAAELIASASGVQWDVESSTPWTQSDPTHQLWYDDAESLSAKAAYAVGEGLGGVGLWALTYADSDQALWRALDAQTHTGGLQLAAPTPGLVDTANTFAVSGALPGELVWVVAGTADGWTPIPGCSNDLPFSGAVVVGNAFADASGVARVEQVIPSTALGRELFLQAVRTTDCHVSGVRTAIFTDPAASPCGPHMVLSGAVCVDAYEAALEEYIGGTWQPADPWETVDGRVVRAVPAAGIQPQGYISGDEAAAACAASGKRLCTSAEWLSACQGSPATTWPYGASYQPGACNDVYAGGHPVVDFFGTSVGIWDPVHMNDPGINQMAGTTTPGGSKAACVSAVGAWDMHGNLHEWVADASGTFRGGFYADAAINGAGCTYATTAHTRTYHDYSTGFRCCSDVP